MRDTFAFVIHPISPKRDASRKFPMVRRFPEWLIEFLAIFFPPVFISEIKGVRSLDSGRDITGWFVACPLTPRLMTSLPVGVVYRKIIQAGRMAEKLGARILGLGAFTSVVGDGGITVARQLNIPVTTGNSYTIAIAMRAIGQAAKEMGIDPKAATAAVVGAYGSIGAVCAEMLAPTVQKLILVGRDMRRLENLAGRLAESGRTVIEPTTEINRLKEAHLIITVTSAVDSVIRPEHLRPGAVICDVARPRDVSRQVAQQRQDVLVIEGGMVAVPGQVTFGFNFGFPAGMAYACMAETMTLALEQRYESFTLGKEIQLAQATTIDTIAERHGFRLGGFRSFEKAVTSEEIRQIKALAFAWQSNQQN